MTYYLNLVIELIIIPLLKTITTEKSLINHTLAISAIGYLAISKQSLYLILPVDR